jgi:biopolymer transport protein ExbD
MASPRGEGKQGGLLPVIIIGLLISLATSAVTLFAYDRWCVQKIVAVDMKGYITLQRYKYQDGKINDEDLRKAFDRLEQMMNTIPKNRVVIMADTAIRNAEVFKLGHEEELKQYEELLRRSLQRNPAAQEQ